MAIRVAAIRSTTVARDVALGALVANLGWFGGTAVSVGIATAMGAALVWRRRRSLTVMLVVVALAMVYYLAGPADRFDGAGIDLYWVPVVTAMVAVVRHAERLWHALMAGGIAMLAGAAVWLDYAGFPTGLYYSDLDVLLALAMWWAGCLAAWLTAYVARTRREYLESLRERAATAERERDQLARLAAAGERAGIARELHDIVAHSLAVMIIQAGGAARRTDDQNLTRTALDTIAATGREALDDMHRIVRVLREGQGAHAAEPDRERTSLAQLATVVERARAAGLQVELRTDGDPPAGLSAADELTLFRLAQEGLTNTLRHAAPGAVVTVVLRFGEEATVVEIEDDGGGRYATTPELTGEGCGSGLIGMRERVALYGGRLTAGPRVGPGWHVRAELPTRSAS